MMYLFSSTARTSIAIEEIQKAPARVIARAKLKPSTLVATSAKENKEYTKTELNTNLRKKLKDINFFLI